MIQFLAGPKGVGKTKRLIKMANESVKTSAGHLVFIDDDKRHIYDLHYDIRFVDTKAYHLANYREFVGFIYGVLSQNSDIEEIYVDGLTNIVETIDNEALVKLVAKLEQISSANKVDFIIVINYEIEDLPDEVRGLVAEP